MKTTLICKGIALGLLFASLVATVSVADTHANLAVYGQANVRVWVEGGDVFADYADVAIWLRPERDCYATLFMVDTDGYMHVLYPSSPYDDEWLYGGRSYCYRACDLGLDRLDGAGIAYVFAVGSPVPFDYSCYGAGVFVGGFGFRVYGDPFVACRDFYMTLLPVSCRWDYVGVSYAHFYVRHWARYPSYLCYGGPGIHVFVGDGCRVCNDVYVSYRQSCARPWDAFRPAPKFKQQYADGRVYQNDQNRVDGYARTSRLERVQRDAFKGSRGESFQVAQRSKPREYATKPIAKSWSRDTNGADAKRTAIAPRTRTTPTWAVRAPENQQRVISTSSARERASVDKATVAAMHRTASVRGSGSNDAGAHRTETATKRASTHGERGKGTSK